MLFFLGWVRLREPRECLKSWLVNLYPPKRYPPRKEGLIKGFLTVGSLNKALPASETPELQKIQPCSKPKNGTLEESGVTWDVWHYAHHACWNTLTRWWFHFFLFTPIWGRGLKPPTRSRWNNLIVTITIQLPLITSMQTSWREPGSNKANVCMIIFEWVVFNTSMIQQSG